MNQFEKRETDLSGKINDYELIQLLLQGYKVQIGIIWQSGIGFAYRAPNSLIHQYEEFYLKSLDDYITFTIINELSEAYLLISYSNQFNKYQAIIKKSKFIGPYNEFGGYEDFFKATGSTIQTALSKLERNIENGLNCNLKEEHKKRLKVLQSREYN